MIENKLGLTENTITTHFGRHSGAVALADAGISMPNLKRADRWASISVVEQYMKHSHTSKDKRVTLLNRTQKSTAAAKKIVKSIETSSEYQWKEGSNNTECSDGSNYSSSNNRNSDYNDYSKTDQKLPATTKSSKNKQANVKQEVATHKELLATIPLPPTGHLNISNCTFNMGTMTTETKQVEFGKSPTKLPAAN
eukprot:6137002-Ditylum_brightwellii.AAC.1